MRKCNYNYISPSINNIISEKVSESEIIQCLKYIPASFQLQQPNNIIVNPYASRPYASRPDLRYLRVLCTRRLRFDSLCSSHPRLTTLVIGSEAAALPVIHFWYRCHYFFVIDMLPSSCCRISDAPTFGRNLSDCDLVAKIDYRVHHVFNQLPMCDFRAQIEIGQVAAECWSEWNEWQHEDGNILITKNNIWNHSDPRVPSNFLSCEARMVTC